MVVILKYNRNIYRKIILEKFVNLSRDIWLLKATNLEKVDKLLKTISRHFLKILKSFNKN